jgi:hypothetical protein
MNIASHTRKITLVGLALSLSAMGCGGGSMMTGTGGSGMTGSGGSGAGGSGGDSKSKFSFFVTSIEAIMALSPGQKGFGGDLSFGETGEGAGLRGADKICKMAAGMGIVPGAGDKTWRAFLSTSGGATGTPVHASQRIGTGPWYDARGLQVASNLTQLLMERPGDADEQIKNDLPNEMGIPNHMQGGCSGSACPANHAVLTGTNAAGMLYTGGASVAASTCNDWTSKEPSGTPWCGHSWPRTGSGKNWMASTSLDGCAPCLGQNMGTNCVGDTGGYGGIYCFAID